jgi:hypothetical protein
MSVRLEVFRQGPPRAGREPLSMSGQIPLPKDADDPQRDAARNDGVMEVLPDLAYKRLGDRQRWI